MGQVPKFNTENEDLCIITIFCCCCFTYFKNSVVKTRRQEDVIVFGTSPKVGTAHETWDVENHNAFGDHPYITSAEGVVGGFKNKSSFCWRSLLYYCWHTLILFYNQRFILATHNIKRLVGPLLIKQSGWVGQKMPKMCWRNIWMVPCKEGNGIVSPSHSTMTRFSKFLYVLK